MIGVKRRIRVKLREGKYTRIAAIATVLGVIIAFFAWQFPINPDDNNSELPVKEAPSALKDKTPRIKKSNVNFRFPPKADILIFNACDLNSAHSTLQKLMSKEFTEANVSTHYDWLLRHEMNVTHIFYITQSFKRESKLLQEWFPGKQYVVDYQNQSATSSPDLKYRMIGLDKRDLVIFLGNDYHKIFSVFGS